MQSTSSKSGQSIKRSIYSQKTRNEQASLKRQASLEHSQSQNDALYLWKKETRSRFFTRLVQEVKQKGPETLDRAWTFYPQSSSFEDLSNLEVDLAHLQVIKDDFLLPKANCFGSSFAQLIQEQWWTQRKSIIQHEGQEPIQALCGFYGRYLGSSGFSCVFEYNAQDEVILWRVDARGQGVQVKLPEDEGDFYDQFATFLDLHHAWRWLFFQHQNTQHLITREVEPGYVIGVRKGDPHSEEDPAEREDPEIEENFSRFDLERFDSLEFLNGEVAEHLPFQDERYSDWLDEHHCQLLDQGEIELFVLADAQGFFNVIEEISEVRQIEVEWIEHDQYTSYSLQNKTITPSLPQAPIELDDPLLDFLTPTPEKPPQEGEVVLRFSRGPLSFDRHFSFPFLWTLHTGRYFYEGALAFFRADLERLFQASELYFNLLSTLESLKIDHGYHYEVSHETLILSRQGKPIVDLDLMMWSSLGAFEGKEGALRLLEIMGYQTDTHQWIPPNHALHQCPICQKEAMVKRALRPQSHMRTSSKIHYFNHQHLWGYYSLNCPQHHLPIYWGERREIEEQFTQTNYQYLPVETEWEGDQYRLLWGTEIAGSLMDTNIRESLRDQQALFAYAFTPDLIALSMLPFDETRLQSIRPQVQMILEQKAPHRQWWLDWSVDLH